MDNVQPAMLNDYTEGKDWIAKGVRLSQILERNAIQTDRYPKSGYL